MIPNELLGPLATVLVAAITGLVAAIAGRRSAKVQDRQTDVDHDDKILSHYDGLVKSISSQADRLEEKLKEMERRAADLSEELNLIKGLFEESIRYIRRVRNWYNEGGESTFPSVPYSLNHLFDRTSEITLPSADRKPDAQ